MKYEYVYNVKCKCGKSKISFGTQSDIEEKSRTIGKCFVCNKSYILESRDRIDINKDKYKDNLKTAFDIEGNQIVFN